MQKRNILASLATVVAGFTLAMAAPLTASAHISVTPNSADPGSSQNFVFKAVNESETDTTTKVEISLPTDTPIVSVKYQPTPGWVTEVITSTLPEPVSVGGNTISEAPTKLVFTAEAGGEILPGQFQQWTVSFGPIPETGSLLFPAVQTYSNGQIVNWTSTAEEVESDATLKAAPVLFVQDEVVADHHAGASSDEKPSGDSASTDKANTEATAEAAETQSGLTLGLSIAALALAAIAAVLGAVAVFGRRKKNSA